MKNGFLAGAGALYLPKEVFAEERDREFFLKKVVEMESNWNPNAMNQSGARGLAQIMPDVLVDWNTSHPNEQYKDGDLFTPKINLKIARWYLGRLERYLEKEGLETHEYNILAAYNWGPGNVKKLGDARENFSKLPLETRNFIMKYWRLSR